MEGQYIDAGAILEVLRRRARLILMVFLAISTLSAIIVFSLRPEYTASALVMVDPSRKDLLDPGLAQMGPGPADGARVDSEVEIVTSMPVLLEVVETAGLIDDPEFAPKRSLQHRLASFLGAGEPVPPTREETLHAAALRLDEVVSARRRGSTYLIAVNAAAPGPEAAARIANAVAETYIRMQVQSKVRSVLAALEVLEPRIANASAALAASESALDTFLDDNLERIAANSGRQDIVALKQAADARLGEQVRLGSAIEAASASLLRADFEQMATVLASPELANLAWRHAELLNGPGGGSGAEIEALEALLDRTAQDAMAGLQGQLAEHRAQTAELREELRHSLLASDMPPDVLTGLYELQQESALARASYERLVARVHELRAQADLQVADSRIVAAATAPQRPSFPDMRLMFLMAGVGAMGFGVALAFTVENLVGGFTSLEQLEAVTRRGGAVAVSLQKPPQRADGSPAASVADTVALAPFSQFSECLRRLKLNLDQALVGSGNRQRSEGGVVVAVASSVPLEGKTTLALGLARTYAASGRKVLLIDGDLRHPSVHRHLGVAPSGGLSDYLSSSLADAIPATMLSSDPLSEVVAVLGGRHGETPGEQLLTSGTFARLIAAARSVFEVTIIDTPPVGVVVDGSYVLELADAVVFAVRWADTGQREVLRSLDAVDSSTRPDVPIVLAMTQKATERDRKGRYRAYYAEEQEG
ncbi:GumC family protein [Devosia honganensis]|uniref:GumC family protein n=1 Tax=Devosia honganensis TaxID=1610527 RepID=A0ABV7X683_9HYPH